nr:hypothetical protein [Tanacetum cinerariifolium]
MSYLTDYEEINEGYVAFGGNPKGGKITSKGTIRTGKLDFKNVYFLRELKFNLFSVSQMCDKKNSVLFNDTECIVLSSNFKLIDESQVLLRVPRKNNMYSVDLKNIVPKGGLTCLFAKAISDESKLCHRRLGHLNFKTMNKLVKGNLDETSGILKSCITRIENLVDHKVKVIRCDNETEFKNREIHQFCEIREVVDTACYAQNRMLVVKPHNKTLYELFRGKTPTLSFMKPFGCPVTFLNTLDHLGKFDGKADEGFFIGYSLSSKAFRVFNSRKRIVEENLHIMFCENTPNVVGSGPDWLFDIDALTRTINYEPISADDGFQPSSDSKKKVNQDPSKVSECRDQEQDDNVNNTKNVNAVTTNRVNAVSENISSELPFDPNMPALEDISTFNFSSDHEDDDEEADMNNMSTIIQVSHVPTTKIHKDHPLDQVIRDLHSTTQTRNMSKNLEEHGFVSTIHQRTNHKDLQNCLFACFLTQEEPRKNKKDERGIVIRNKARLVAQGHTQEEGIDYDEVFTHVARIEAIRLILAYASFKDFVVYQMDVKSDFLYGKIEEEVYVCQPPGFEDLDFPNKVYKVKKALYRLHQAPRAWYETLSTYLLDNGFHRGKIDKTLFIRRHKGDILLVQVYVDDIIFGSTKKELCIAFERMMHEKFQMSYMGELTFFLGLQMKQKQDGIFISQDKYVTEILKKYRFTEVKNASTPMETQMPLLKDEDVCACARYQVNLKVSHLHVVKRIFSARNRQWLQIPQQKQNMWLLQVVMDKRDLQFGDEEGVDCLPTATIFEQIALIGILDLEKTKTTQALEIDSLKRRVEKLEKKQRSRTYKLKRQYKVGLTARVESLDNVQSFGENASKQGRISDINADGGITLVSTHDDAEMFVADKDLHGEEVFVTEHDENVVEKSKAIMIEEPVKLKKKDQIMLDEEVALKLQAEIQAEFDKEQRLASEKAQQEEEANIALIKT